MKSMGGMAGLLDKMPGMGGMAQAASTAGTEKNFDQMECIINSMTPKRAGASLTPLMVLASAALPLARVLRFKTSTV